MALGGGLRTFENSDDAYAFVAGLDVGEQRLLLVALLNDMPILAVAETLKAEGVDKWIK